MKYTNFTGILVKRNWGLEYVKQGEWLQDMEGMYAKKFSDKEVMRHIYVV